MKGCGSQTGVWEARHHKLLVKLSVAGKIDDITQLMPLLDELPARPGRRQARPPLAKSRPARL